MTNDEYPMTTDNNLPPTRWGCWLSAALLLILPALFVAGGWWLIQLLPDLVGSPDPFWQVILRLAAVPLVVSLLAGLALWSVGRIRGAELWRGVGVAVLVTAVHTLGGGLLLALDHWLGWPGLPHSTPALFSLLVAAVVFWLYRDFYRGPRDWGLAGWGFGGGLLLTWSYAYFGSLGTAMELWLAIVDALGTAAIATLLLTLPFAHTPDTPRRHPYGAPLLAALLLAALAPTLLATRGFWSQGVNLTAVLVVAAIFPASLLGLAPQQAISKTWPAMLASLFGLLILPLALVEGAEGDVMLGDWTWALTFAVGVAAVLAPLFALGQMALRQPLRRIFAQPLLATSLVALLLVALGFSYALAGGSGLQPELFVVVMAEQADTVFARTITNREERVTAVYNTLTTHANTSQADLRGYLDGRGLPYTPYYLVNALEVEGNWFLRWQLEQRDDVETVLISPQTRPLRDFWVQNQASSLQELTTEDLPGPNGPTWGVQAIGADKVWAEFGVTGEGIIVGIADSGSDWNHPDLRPSYAGQNGQHDYHWYDPALGTAEPTDQNGHGTHTAGTVAGQGGIGVAPGAQWIACRNLPRNLGNPADYLACMQFLFAPFPLGGDAFADGDPTRGAHITNNSWGCPPVEGCDGRVMGLGAHHLYNAGQMMVVSNGNSGPACETTGEPANHDEVLSVGASNEAGAVTDFSSRGPAVDYDGDVLTKPDLVAPGEDVLSSWLNGEYVAIPGTSMAGPHVVGVVALLWSAAPELVGDVEGTTQLLLETATPIIATNTCTQVAVPNNAAGFGLVDVYAAVGRVVGR